MSVLGGLEFRPESAARHDTPQADTRPEPGLLEQAGAARRVQEDTILEVQTSRLWDAYRPLTEALIERGVDPRTLQRNGGRGAPSSVHGFDHARIWREAQRLGIEGLPATQAEFEQQALRRAGEPGGGRDADQALMQRGTGAGATIAQFAGGMIGGLEDIRVIGTLPFGGFGRHAATRIATEALVGATGAAIALPGTASAYGRMGEDFTAGDAAMEVGFAAAGGAVVRGGLELAPKVDAAAYRAAAPVRERFDRFFADRDLARAMSQAVPEHAQTPEQAAALHVLEREADIDEASPYVRTIAGDEAHRARLQEASERLGEAGGPRRGLGNLNGAIVSFFRLKGYSEAHARGIAAGVEAESRSDHRAVNPTSGAFGIGQWLGPRKAELFRRYGNNPTLNEQLEFLHYELQGGDHGGKAVLAETTEEGVLSAYIGETRADGTGWGFMRPLHGAQRQGDMARGMAALGRAGEAVPEGTPNAWAAVDPGDDLPVVRPEALDAERPFVSSAGRQVPIAAFRPADIDVDAELMQFKSGGDDQGVTDRLQGVPEWDPIAAGLVTVWEGADGRRLIADGHQRLGLAKRLEAEGQEISLNAFVLREAEGYSASDARIITAIKNIGEGTGSALDAAKVFRALGENADDWLRSLPPRSALVRDGKALARLGDEALGAAINDVIPEGYAAAIGHLAPDPATHMALVELLAKTDPPNRRQAEAIVKQALEAGFTKEVQDELFGARELTSALFLQRARLLDKALLELKRLKGAFGVTARNAEALEGVGNTIDVAGTTAAAADNGRALALVERLALRKGNAVNAIIDQAAQRLAAGEPLARVVRDVVKQLRELDLADLERTAPALDSAGDGASGSGRDGFDPREAGEAQSLTDAERDALEETVDLGPSLFDDPASPVARAFDDDAGEGVQAAAESDWHDIRAAQLNDLTPGVKSADIGAALEARIAADPAAARAEYEAIDDPETGLTTEGGRILNTDLARELSPEYRADRSRSQEVHEAASAFVKQLYADKLAEPVPAGRDKEVLFTAGGTGAGKSTGLNALGGENAGIIYDTNMNTAASAIAKIDQALAAGWDVHVLYVFRDPVEALVNGALPRAERMGRTVPIEAHVDTHVGARQAIAALAERYAADDRVQITAIDNSRGKGGATPTELENLPDVPREGLHEQLETAARAAHEAGAIGERTLAGTLGEGARADAAVRGQPEPADRGQVNPLDRGAAADPNIADRQRQAAELGAAAPLRARAEQDGTIGSPLFDAADQPTFDLEEIGVGRGKGPLTAAEIEAELAAERAGLEEIRKCLK